MKHLILIIAALALLSSAKGQNIKAITQHGETVVLYENGTWKYEKDLQDGSNSQATIVPGTSTPKAATVTTLTIDKSKEVTSDRIELCNAVSKKLSRFFGEEKGRVRCFVTTSNIKGEVLINFEFMIQIGDANRYFGYTAQDRNITLHLTNGQTVTTSFSKNVEEKFIEKWNASYYKASAVIAEEDIYKLLRNPLQKMTVDWKKRAEEYIVDNASGLQLSIAEIL